MILQDLGLLGLFLATFASSTILPLPSEAFVLGFIALKYDGLVVLLVASLGNTLGSLTTYYLGYVGLTKILEYFGHLEHKKILYFKHKSRKYGALLAFFSFLPFFGDIFVLALGLARYNLATSVFLIALGKTLRYTIVIFGTEKLLQIF
ncbi:hypothetical protein BBW65_07255 [Helicobacter enhydrae]|uniref:VTT domain-containing protein n=1 Tax=Helicobacter enhydrae TaxID=222136 RepID=A0A1B1U739_9HELI|nr:YqaA family protein [Helicobacter enhydrae]ANV98604.1 hypothetical protein BBW65_07255 [Helicobacter enhydrae]